MKKKTNLPLDLGEGLILRRATPKDAQALAEFNGRVHNDADFDGEPTAWITHWTKTLIRGNHPTTTVNDFLIVVDTVKDRIASSAMVLPQTWAYENIPFGVGRIELVGTHPDYRRRGLIRKQFEVLHEWCEARDMPVQAITGIPWYYRLFGYEMTLQLHGGRSGAISGIPKLKKDEQEQFTFRTATVADIPFLAEVYGFANKRSAISSPRTERDWVYLLTGVHEDQAYVFKIIENKAGEAVGYVSHNNVLWGSRLAIVEYEIKEDGNWHAPLPALLRYIKKAGESLAEKEKEDAPEFSVFSFQFGSEHPVYELRPDWYPMVRTPYAWYLRVADLRNFLEKITPVLEARLADSALAGYSREVKLNFYTSGIKLIFEQGKIVQVETWQPKQNEGEVRFPDQTFLHMLFCHRSFQSLDEAYADCYASEEIPALLNILFPHKPSMVQALA